MLNFKFLVKSSDVDFTVGSCGSNVNIGGEVQARDLNVFMLCPLAC